MEFQDCYSPSPFPRPPTLLRLKPVTPRTDHKGLGQEGVVKVVAHGQREEPHVGAVDGGDHLLFLDLLLVAHYRINGVDLVLQRQLHALHHLIGQQIRRVAHYQPRHQTQVVADAQEQPHRLEQVLFRVLQLERPHQVVALKVRVSRGQLLQVAQTTGNDTDRVQVQVPKEEQEAVADGEQEELLVPAETLHVQAIVRVVQDKVADRLVLGVEGDGVVALKQQLDILPDHVPSMVLLHRVARVRKIPKGTIAEKTQIQNKKFSLLKLTVHVA